MEKTRIYELAKELNVDNKVLLAKLDEMQIAYKNHMSSVSFEVAQELRKSIAPKQSAAKVNEAANNDNKKSGTAENIMLNKANESKNE